MAKKSLDERIEGAKNFLKENLNTVRAGRANPALLDKIMVNYYGTPTPLKALANISVPDPRTLMISPFDPKSVADIERAILEANVGITPSNDGITIRLPFPKPTEERRKELVRECNKYAEEGKIAVRNARRHANEKAERAEKEGEITEDDLKREKKAIQKLTDDYTKKVDELLKAKSAEVMEI